MVKRKKTYNYLPLDSSLIRFTRRYRRFPVSLTTQAWLIWFVSMLFVLFQFSLQLSSGEIVMGLMRSFHFSAFGASILSASYYYIYVCFQIPAGMLLDRYGPRRLLCAGALFAGIGCFLFGISPWVWLNFAGRILSGAGCAFAFVGSLTLVSRWFPVNKFALMVGIVEMVGMFGSLAASMLIAKVVLHYDWRAMMLAAAVVAVLLAVVLWLVVRDRPRHVEVAPVLPYKQVWHDFKQILKLPMAWCNGVFSGVMFSVISVFAALWGVPFLQHEHHLNLVHAAFFANLIFIGTAIGCPVISWLDNFTERRRVLLMFTSLLAAASISMVIFDAHLLLWQVAVFMIVTGFFSAGYLVTFAIGNEIAPVHVKGASIGFVNALSVIMAPILQMLVGYFLAHGAVNTLASHFSTHDYQKALLVIPLLLVLASICAWFLPRRPIAC